MDLQQSAQQRSSTAIRLTEHSSRDGATIGMDAEDVRCPYLLDLERHVPCVAPDTERTRIRGVVDDRPGLALQWGRNGVPCGDVLGVRGRRGGQSVWQMSALALRPNVLKVSRDQFGGGQ